MVKRIPLCLNLSFEQEVTVETSMQVFMEKVLSPYILIAKSKGVPLDTDFSDDFSASFPVNAMEKALSLREKSGR